MFVLHVLTAAEEEGRAQADAMESKLVSLKAQVDALRSENEALSAAAAKAQRQQEEDERTIQVGA
jgi:hypothetical protein